METTLLNINKILSDENITIVFGIENQQIEKTYNLINYLNSMKVNSDFSTKNIWSNYILIDEIFESEIIKINYSLKFLINIHDNIFVNQVNLIIHNRKLACDLIGKDIRNIKEINFPDFIIDNEKKMLFYNFKNIPLIIEIENKFFIKSYYCIPEFYKYQRIVKFIAMMNENNYEMKTESELNKFYVNDKEIGYYCEWDIKNYHLNNNRFTEKYLYMFVNEGLLFNIETECKDFIFSKNKK